MPKKNLSRRTLLSNLSASASLLILSGCAKPFSIMAKKQRAMIPRPDLLPAGADSALKVFQLSDDEVACAHVYMEAQVFTPDSKRFVLRRAAWPHDGDRYSPEHRFLLCDLDNGGELSPLTHEMGVAGPSLSPDGNTLYYFVGERRGSQEIIHLKRVSLDGSRRDTIHVIDSVLPGTSYRPSKLYPLSTISSDGKRIAISCFLGDGETDSAPFGLLVYDLERASVELILWGTTWLNIHPQYSRSLDPEASHDILIQENHGVEYDRNGQFLPGKLVGGHGADIHVIRDDGTNFRTMPCGRARAREACQGHQCWRGRSTSAVIGTSSPGQPGQKGKLELIETRAVRNDGHLGMAAPGAWRNNLSRSFSNPRFSHFGVDIAGERILSDSPVGGRWLLHCAKWAEAEGDPLEDWRFLLDSHSSKNVHPHPFLSPDGDLGFFNSDESGIIQSYMLTGLWST